ncbi:glycosyltransferase 87 family protein [Actinomadura viridis]|uniref:Alpha-1,2-mannosyltransferase n=1 Tax=Actinomadura viridis TaxID=58110 RepID=A0A931DIM2_9ACTN|nr:glycosyltransferase 87 family protein [Actinomadura viridis]MBG6091874.1 alpha-1,2-mannosyltransferase [Actinomadura viridis]
MLAIEFAGVVVFAVAYRSLDHYIYWLGGQAIMDGARLYQERLAGLWFTNTPFMAVLSMPMAALPLTVARTAWQLASVAAFAWACVTTLRLAGRRPSRSTVTAAVALGFLLEPIWHSVFLGQVNLFLLALVLTDIRRVSQGRAAGIGIGVAAAIKLTPAIFIVLLLAAGRVRAAVTAAATFVLCATAAYAVAPDASRLYWLHTFYDTSRVGVPYISNQSPYGAAVRILGGVDGVGAWFQVVPIAAGICGLAVAALWARRGDWLSAVAVTGTTGLLVSPISWAHHWVWVVPALAVLLRNGNRRSALAGYLLFLLAVPWWTPRDGGPDEYGFHGLLTFAANGYLVAGLAFLVHMAVRLRGTSGWTAATPERQATVTARPVGWCDRG